MKTKTLFTAIILVSLTCRIFAEGHLSVWANCNANNGNNGNKRQSFAAAWCGLSYYSDKRRACTGNTPLCNVQVFGQAGQQAICGPDLAFLSGFTKKWYCNKGQASLGQYLNSKYTLNPAEDGYEEQIVEADNIDRSISNDIIKINNFRGKITNNFVDYASVVSIRIWKPSANDTVPTDANSIYLSQIYYANGEINLTNFSANDVSFSYDPLSGTGDISFHIDTIAFNIKDFDDDFDGNDYVISIISDSYAIDEENARVMTNLTEQKITDKSIVFEVTPNPSSGEIAVNFKNNNIADASVNKLLIFNGIGKLEREIKIDDSGRHESFSLDIKSMAAGVYYILLIDNNNDKFLKKVIKN